MERKELRKIFNEIKKEANLDFCLTQGTCCQTCTWAEIVDKYGEESRGIWLKWFRNGANASRWEDNDCHYIAHDLTEKQKDIVYNILRKYFRVEWDFSDSACIKIYMN